MLSSLSQSKRQYSSSSSEDDDEDWNESNLKKKKQIRGRPVKKITRPTIKDSDDDDENGFEREDNEINFEKKDKENDKEEGEVDDDEEEEVEEDDDDNEFNDGYDENLMGDEDDQKRLSMMTEKEREQELFNRSEKREVLKTRFEIEKKLRLAKKKEQNKSSSDVQIRSIDRRKVLESNRKQKDGLKALKEQREKRKQKAKLRASDVYSSSSSDDEDDIKRKSSSSSTSSSSDDDSDCNRRRKSDDDFDIDKKNKEEIPFVFGIKELNSVRISRFKLSQWCHTPFFKDTVIGCFVRLSIGVNKDKTPIYRVAEIVDILQGPKVYDLEKTKTDKLLKLKHGHDEKNFRIEYVSNTEFTEKEFNDWKIKMEKERLSLPSRKNIEDKKKSIHTAINYNFKEADIEAIVKEKEKYKELPVNFAMKKTHLKKQKDMAEQIGDHVEVERISQLLEEIEEKAKELDHKRTQSISAISYINERNRMKNIVEAEKAILEARELDKLKQGDEPFKRRKCAPMLVSMVKRQDNAKINNTDTKDLNVNNSINNSPSNSKNSINFSNGVNKMPSSNSKLFLKESSPSNHDEQGDLFSAHDFDIQIDFDISSGLNTNSNNGINNSLYSSNLSTSNLVSNKKSRRSLNLEEYKKKKSLI